MFQNYVNFFQKIVVNKNNRMGWQLPSVISQNKRKQTNSLNIYNNKTQ